MWFRDKKKLIEIYRQRGVIRCELCGSDWGMSFHHLDKRSSGKAKNTFEDTRLLCAQCHADVEYDKEANEKLKKCR